MFPPTAFGGYNTDLLAACHALGVTEVHRIGGAQAVAALAYGVEGIAPVQKIVGPGNLFVALAKRQVYGEVDIDSIAGPSEVVVLADWTANPRFVAADLISQAEHSPGASLLITWEPDLIERVADALTEALATLSRGDLARRCLEDFGALILVKDEDEAVGLTNAIAPNTFTSPRPTHPALPSVSLTRGRSSWDMTRQWPWATTRQAHLTCCPREARPGGRRGFRRMTSSRKQA